MTEPASADQPPSLAEVQRRVKRIAERAFWDSVRDKLAGGGGAVEQAAALLGELGGQLAEVLPAGASEAAELAARLDPQRLAADLAPPSAAHPINLPALLGLLEWSAALLARLGAPARGAAAAEGQDAVRRQLGAAGSDPAAAAAAAARALWLLSVQLKVLRADVGEWWLAWWLRGKHPMLLRVPHGSVHPPPCPALPPSPAQPTRTCACWPPSCAPRAPPPMPPPS